MFFLKISEPNLPGLLTSFRSMVWRKCGKPCVKHLEKGLGEIRMKGRDGISRALYVVAKPKRVVVVRVFVKKTQKTPRKEIKLALKRAGEIT